MLPAHTVEDRERANNARATAKGKPHAPLQIRDHARWAAVGKPTALAVIDCVI